MNGANHQMNAVSTFPFYTLEGWDMAPPERADLPRSGKGQGSVKGPSELTAKKSRPPERTRFFYRLASRRSAASAASTAQT